MADCQRLHCLCAAHHKMQRTRTKMSDDRPKRSMRDARRGDRPVVAAEEAVRRETATPTAPPSPPATELSAAPQQPQRPPAPEPAADLPQAPPLEAAPAPA